MPRLRQPRDPRLLTKVSRFYYDEKLSENEISMRLHLSRSKVSRLLHEARDLGIVHISIVPPPSIYTDLEQLLESKYSLQEAVVVDVVDGSNPDAIARALGLVAARHLQQSLYPGDTIGITWGRTLYAMVRAVQPQKRMNNHVVQIIGGLGPPTAEVHATDLCRRIGNMLDCSVTLLPAPGIVGSWQIKEAFLQDQHIQENLQLYPSISVAYVGIGAPTPDSVIFRDGSIMSRAEMDSLCFKGAVGDIALRFFDQYGKPIDSELDQRVIGITLDQLRRIKRVVGVAGGLEKVAAVHGALLGGYIDVLITDQMTARKLLG